MRGVVTKSVRFRDGRCFSAEISSNSSPEGGTPATAACEMLRENAVFPQAAVVVCGLLRRRECRRRVGSVTCLGCFTATPVE